MWGTPARAHHRLSSVVPSVSPPHCTFHPCTRSDCAGGFLSTRPHHSPLQLTTTHPPLGATFSSAVVSGLDPSTLATAPPIQAYQGLRHADPGSANDRRMASAECSRPAPVAQRSNIPRVRSSTSRSIASFGNASVDATHSAAPAIPASVNDPSTQILTVLLIPFQVGEERYSC